PPPPPPLFALLLAFAFVPHGWTQSAEESELRELRTRIKSLQKEMERSEGTRDEARDALRESERAISQANRRIFEIAARRRELNAELSRLQRQQQEAESRIAAEQKEISRLLYRQYVHGQPEALRLLLNRQDPNETARQLQYLGYVSRARAELIGSLRENLESLRTVAEETREKHAALRSLEKEEATQKTRLERQKAARQRVIANASTEIAKHRRQISTLRRDEQRLTNLIERLAKEAARAREQARLRNRALPDASANAAAFAKLKGRLRLPVIGELANRFGGQRKDGGLAWKGLFISAKSGQEVKAIAPGKIVYADWLRGFGNLMIIDHGGGYMSLYGNNEALLKQVGDDTRAGDTIASVGNSGGNPDSGLYFELRHQGRPFDPLPWVNLN
ncbi:MAG: peptidoglycan DD-metalloendopeptidase family protein, partial [Burkholderiales bacterium]